ncbi:Hsp20/alpha crystallin family protein [Portibacter marinus]|uniref:Hsp20/alpha crystallin family protein n=1 Tax=Portibacter marinus TaxID=2898660 RepID=UPI001F4872CB|nr:Hsp20/alpha crystallin family protein [Portibacter marinus]
MLPVKNSLLPTVSRFFDDDWNNLFDWNTGSTLARSMNMPAVNIQENDEDYFVEMAAPGLEKENFKVELDKNRLTISYHNGKNNEEKNEDERFVRREYSYTSFSRSFHLNKNVVDEDKIEAKYHNGVLNITIPKREEAKEKPARLIEIS